MLFCVYQRTFFCGSLEVEVEVVRNGQSRSSVGISLNLAMLFTALRCATGVCERSLVSIERISFSLCVPCLGRVAPILTVVHTTCEVAPVAGRVPHLLEGFGAFPREQSTSRAHQSPAPPGRVTILVPTPSDECHFQPISPPQASEHEGPEEIRHEYDVMRRASISPPPQRYVDFEGL